MSAERRLYRKRSLRPAQMRQCLSEQDVQEALATLEKAGLIVPIPTDDGRLAYFLPYADSAVRRRSGS